MATAAKRFGKVFQRLKRSAYTVLFQRSCASSSQNTTHFGYETVTEEEKAEKVHHVFHNVAEKYDLMNDLMSGGIHRVWKNYFIQQINPSSGNKLLDVAGGTGDIAIRYLNYVRYKEFKRKARKQFPLEKTEIVLCDINQAMLDVGKRRAKKLGIYQGLSWICGNGEQLPFEDNSFDVYTIAFGLRNFTNIEKALDEAYRVLVPGGRFMCLEFSEVANPVISRLYDSYSFQVIPVMGQIIAKDWESYQYLVESIRQFPDQDEFTSMIKSSGFSKVNYENLTFGIAAIHSGFKL